MIFVIIEVYVLYGMINPLNNSEILRDLKKAKNTYKKLQTLDADINNYRLTASGIKKKSLYIDFTAKWKNIKQSHGFNADFYLVLYNKLVPFIGDVDYPDESDHYRNNDNALKKDDLILFVSSIVSE